MTDEFRRGDVIAKIEGDIVFKVTDSSNSWLYYVLYIKPEFKRKHSMDAVLPKKTAHRNYVLVERKGECDE